MQGIEPHFNQLLNYITKQPFEYPEKNPSMLTHRGIIALLKCLMIDVSFNMSISLFILEAVTQWLIVHYVCHAAMPSVRS